MFACLFFVSRFCKWQKAKQSWAFYLNSFASDQKNNNKVLKTQLCLFFLLKYFFCLLVFCGIEKVSEKESFYVVRSPFLMKKKHNNSFFLKFIYVVKTCRISFSQLLFEWFAFQVRKQCDSTKRIQFTSYMNIFSAFYNFEFTRAKIRLGVTNCSKSFWTFTVAFTLMLLWNFENSSLSCLILMFAKNKCFFLLKFVSKFFPELISFFSFFAVAVQR